MKKYRTWVEINLSNLQKNLQTIKKISPNSKIMSVIKADAYGHNLKKCSHALEKHTHYYGVANYHEAKKIKTKKKIYLLSTPLPHERTRIIKKNLIPICSNLNEIIAFNKIANKLNKINKITISIDTGMGRIGYLPQQFINNIDEITKLKNIQIDSISSHFPSADSLEKKEFNFTKKQINLFENTISISKEKNLKFKYIHIANSAGILQHKLKFNNKNIIIRPGLALYGISPIKNFQNLFAPVLSWHARITNIRTLPENHPISYGRKFITKNTTRTATISIGYGDGYPRFADTNNHAYVSIKNQKAPILGRVTMDQIIIDISNINTKVGDTVSLINNQITVNQLAQFTNTIPWAVFTNISKRVKKIFIKP